MLEPEVRDVLLLAAVMFSGLSVCILAGMVAYKVSIYRSLRAEFGDEPLEERQLRLIQGGRDAN